MNGLNEHRPTPAQVAKIRAEEEAAVWRGVKVLPAAAPTSPDVRVSVSKYGVSVDGIRVG
jgi:hypothetical protein